MSKMPTTTDSALDVVTSWVTTLRPQMGKEYSRERLEKHLLDGLREGRLTLTLKAIEAAEAGDEIADAALWAVFQELVADVFPERKPGHLQIRAYGQRTRRMPLRKPQRWADDWVRNINIVLFIVLACCEFGVAPTRNRDSRRADRDPSGCSLVTTALARNGIHLDEQSIQRHLWFGLPGELVFGVLPREIAERFQRNSV
jgi:hypothetical protein